MSGAFVFKGEIELKRDLLVFVLCFFYFDCPSGKFLFKQKKDQISTLNFLNFFIIFSFFLFIKVEGFFFTFFV